MLAIRSRLSGEWLRSTTPRRRSSTVAFRAKPNRSNCRVGGTMSDTAKRRSRRIWLNSLRISAPRRCPKILITIRLSYAQLHPAHFPPREQIEDRADNADHDHVEPRGGPSAALEERVAHD